MKRDQIQMICVGILILFISGVGLYLSIGWAEDPRRFPRLVLCLFALLGCFLIVQALRGKLVGTYEIYGKELIGPAISLAIILAYIVLIDITGFYVTTAVFLVVYMLYLGQRSWKVLVLSPLIICGFIYLLFTLTLHTPLPHGFLY